MLVDIDRGRLIARLCLAVAASLVLLQSPHVLAEGSTKWTARLVSVEGAVEMQRARQADWLPAASNDELQIGGAIRVQAFSRAAIRLPDETVLRLDQNTTITFLEPQDGERTWLEVLKGIIHVISRDPRALKVITPFANAGLEGTEFLVMVRPQETAVTVFEGAVAISNAAGNVTIQSGQTAFARTGQFPVVRDTLRPSDSVQWTLYYPVVLGYELPVADAEPSPAQINDPRFYTGRAAQRLAVGSAESAEADIKRALAIDPDNADALALQSIIALSNNEKDEALQLANRAVSRDPNSATALIALSYAQQAHFDLSGALETLQQAVDRNPDNALAWSRLAELRLAVGELDEALKAAETAASIDPRVERTQTVLGFALLTQIKIKQAVAAFERAIELDDAAPLPHLGLGLALIRGGNLTAGREEIETAVILDPQNALIRSYMGKAYYEEKRDKLAESQYAIAKNLDSLDPTPWLYDAILKQTINQPVEALQNIQKSIAKNDNRAVYRSRLLLDEDIAARSTSLARIHNDLGFEQLGLLESTNSLNSDPGNNSAHRFLSDIYAALPRHEVARSSELLQSQLLQPLNINPVPPTAAETDLLLLRPVNAGAPTFNEYTSMFERNRVQLQVSGLTGNNATLGDEVAISGVHNRMAFSLGQFHYETDGFRENNDIEHDIYTAYVQASLRYNVDVQAEIRHRETEYGDLRMNFDPTDFSVDDRRDETRDIARVGVRIAPSPKTDLLFSLIHADTDQLDTQVPAAGISSEIDSQSKGYDLQAQLLHRERNVNFVAGIGTYEIDTDQVETLDISGIFPGGICPPIPPFFGICTFVTPTSKKQTQSNAYLYTNVSWPAEAIWTLGVSYDSLDDNPIDVNKFSPKLGLRWNVNKATSLRLAYFETVKRILLVDQTLEPTQIAGFNQFFDDFNGSEAKRYGIGLDVEFSNKVYGGVEASHRDIEVPTVVGGVGPVIIEDHAEDLYVGYLYWTPRPRWALSAVGLFERFASDDIAIFGLPTQIDTLSVPLSVRYFHPSGVFAELGGTHVSQDLEFQTAGVSDESETFFLVDMALGYRIPNRRGIVSIGVQNIFDEDFRYQDQSTQSVDVMNPRYIPGRIIRAQLTLAI